MLILTATIISSIISAVALVTFTYESSDPLQQKNQSQTARNRNKMINSILIGVRKIGSNSVVLKRQKICPIYLVKCSLLNAEDLKERGENVLSKKKGTNIRHSPILQFIMSGAGEDASPKSSGGVNVCEACGNDIHYERLISNRACTDPSHETGA